MRGKLLTHLITSLVLGLTQTLDAQVTTVNYITPVGTDSANVYWAFHSNSPVSNMDEITFVFSLENANEENAYYKEINQSLTLDSILLNPGQIGVPVYEYVYSGNKTVALFNAYYTHTASYNGVVYDRLLGNGVNYYYDKMDFNAEYPTYKEVLSNPNLNQYKLNIDTSKFNNILPTPDYFAYVTNINGAPTHTYQTYTSAGQYAQYFWNTSMPNPVFYQPSPSIYIPNSLASAQDTILIMYPDTIIEEVKFSTWNYRHEEVLYYPVYEELICEGDALEINGNLITEPGLYLDSLTTVLGTDSLVGKKVVVKPIVYTDTTYIELCDGENYLFNQTEYNTTGVYSHAYGLNCDSVHVLDLNVVVIPKEIERINDVISYKNPQAGYTYQWIDITNGVEIEGAIYDSFQPSYNSQYAVEVTNELCTTLSNNLNMTLQLKDIESQMSIAPNPFSDEIHLNFNKEVKQVRIRIVNAQSQIVFSKNYAHTSNVAIQGGYLEAGVYFMTIYDGRQVVTKKILKS